MVGKGFQDVLRCVGRAGSSQVSELTARGVTGHSWDETLYSIVVACSGPSKLVLRQRDNYKAKEP